MEITTKTLKDNIIKELKGNMIFAVKVHNRTGVNPSTFLSWLRKNSDNLLNINILIALSAELNKELEELLIDKKKKI